MRVSQLGRYLGKYKPLVREDYSNGRYGAVGDKSEVEMH